MFFLFLAYIIKGLCDKKSEIIYVKTFEYALSLISTHYMLL